MNKKDVGQQNGEIVFLLGLRIDFVDDKEPSRLEPGQVDRSVILILALVLVDTGHMGEALQAMG